MKLSTGKIAFPIEFDTGDKDVIYFNPNDPNLYVRLNNLKDRVNEKLKNVKDFELNNEGKPENPSDIEAFEIFQKVIYDELDRAFDGNISNIIFKHCSPFAIINGEYFILQFVNEAKKEIEKEIEKSNKDFQKKMSKYLEKYKK